MAEWGRKEYSKAWPSRTPVWTWGAVLLSLLFFAGMLTLQYEQSWTGAERLYLSDYLKSGARGQASATSAGRYTLLEAVVGKGQQRLVIGDEIEPVPDVNGRLGYRLTEEGVKDGIARLTWVAGTFNDRGLHQVMSAAVYGNVGSWEFYRKPVWFALAVFVLLLFVAVPKDRARRMLYKHGRRLRGPELVTTAELSRWARVPRDREAMHFLIVGDSGTGKSAAIRQILAQVWERNEAAIVYDPAMEYLPQFYNEARGDVILNPMDARCPFWTPGDEVPHEAEALTLGRFMSPDDQGGHLGDPQTLNKYVYARNNPLSYVDPDGHDFNLAGCGSTNTATCQNNLVGTTSTDANGKSSFTATVISNGANGLQDQAGNSYSGTVTSAGVSFTQSGSNTSYSGSWINGSADTSFSQTGGALNGFSFNFSQPNTATGQRLAGTFSYGDDMSASQAGAALEKAGFSHSYFDAIFNPIHGYDVTHYRGGGDPNTGKGAAHFILDDPYKVDDGFVMGPVRAGDFHFGETDPRGAGRLYDHVVHEVIPSLLTPH